MWGSVLVFSVVGGWDEGLGVEVDRDCVLGGVCVLEPECDDVVCLENLQAGQEALALGIMRGWG